MVVVDVEVVVVLFVIVVLVVGVVVLVVEAAVAGGVVVDSATDVGVLPTTFASEAQASSNCVATTSAPSKERRTVMEL